jgi:hypothetical protein
MSRQEQPASTPCAPSSLQPILPHRPPFCSHLISRDSRPFGLTWSCKPFSGRSVVVTLFIGQLAAVSRRCSWHGSDPCAHTRRPAAPLAQWSSTRRPGCTSHSTSPATSRISSSVSCVLVRHQRRQHAVSRRVEWHGSDTLADDSILACRSARRSRHTPSSASPVEQLSRRALVARSGSHSRRSGKGGSLCATAVRMGSAPLTSLLLFFGRRRRTH